MKKGIHERVDALEEGIPELFNVLSKNIMSRIAPTLDALVEMMGKDKVEEHIVNKNKEMRLREAEAKKQELEALLASGDLAPAAAISEQSVFVGKEYDSAGNEKFPGRFQFVFGDVAPEFQAKLLGQGKGFVMNIRDSGERFEVQEVFEFVPKPQPAIAEVPPEATASAPNTASETAAVSEAV